MIAVVTSRDISISICNWIQEQDYDNTCDIFVFLDPEYPPLSEALVPIWLAAVDNKKIFVLADDWRSDLSQKLIKLNINCLISVYFPKIIPSSILETVDLAVNVHGGLLPAYRGVLSTMWAIWNAEVQFGATLHEMTDVVDDGKIYDTELFEISDDETSLSLYKKTECVSLVLFDRFLKRYQASSKLACEAVNCDSNSAGIGEVITRGQLPNDGFINMGWSAERVMRLSRALFFPPFSGAKIIISGSIFELGVISLTDSKRLRPGEHRLTGDELVFGTATGSVRAKILATGNSQV